MRLQRMSSRGSINRNARTAVAMVVTDSIASEAVSGSWSVPSSGLHMRAIESAPPV